MFAKANLRLLKVPKVSLARELALANRHGVTHIPGLDVQIQSSLSDGSRSV
jgi:hypothetical protein